MPRTLAITLVLVASGVAVAGCGGSSNATDSSVSAHTTTTSTRSTSATSTRLSPSQRAKKLARYARFVGGIVGRYGTVASPAELATLTPSVQGYVNAVAANEDAKACTFVMAERAKPEEGKSCPELLVLYLERAINRGEHESFTGLVVKGARLSAADQNGYALLGKRDSPNPEVFMAVRHEGGAWKPDVFPTFPYVPPASR